MTEDTRGVVSESRRIAAPAQRIFAVLADPHRHLDLDGSEMVRGVADGSAITGVGDVFVMNMYFDRLGGDYVMRNEVVEFDPPRRIAWAPGPGDDRSAGDRFPVNQSIGHRWIFDLAPDGPDATVVTESYDCTAVAQWFKEQMEYGEIWRDALAATLERLDKTCTG
ncbi:MAG: SRPBCC family protein [Mycobacteriales bacterium]